MMLRYSFSLSAEAENIESAVDSVLNEGVRTADIIGSSGISPVSTVEMTDRILEKI